jgi:putative toxin-antitoxin system antitoxin component (TIGR02293 family)
MKKIARRARAHKTLPRSTASKSTVLKAPAKLRSGLPLVWCARDWPVHLYRAGVMERMMIVKEGVPARYVRVLSAFMHIPVEKLYRSLGLVRPTVDRKLRTARPLSADESERVLGFARLIGQAQSEVEESGNSAQFDAATWMAEWMDQSVPALGGRTPSEFMDTVDGRALIATLLAQQQAGVYA